MSKVRTVLGAFLNIQEDDSSFKRGLRVGDAIARRAFYSVVDYWLMVASGAFIIVVDQQFGYGPLGLFLLMWAFDIIVAGFFVVMWQRTGYDITLGTDYRRAVDSVRGMSRFVGMIAFSVVIIKASFWDGPEHFVIFFSQELKTGPRKSLVLLSLTALQSAIWTPIYVMGFATVQQLWLHLAKTFA